MFVLFLCNNLTAFLTSGRISHIFAEASATTKKKSNMEDRLGWTLYNLFASCICIKNLKNLFCVLIGKSKPGPIFYWSSQIRTKMSLADRNLVLSLQRDWWKTSTAFFHYNTHGFQNEKHV